MSKGHPETVNTGLSDSARSLLAEALSDLLDEVYTLLIQTHVYHWNVRGPLFADLHKMMEEQYLALFESVDEVAERVRQLGFPAPAKGNTFPSGTPIESPMPGEAAMVSGLVERHEATARRLRALSMQADEHQDYVTQDLANEMLAFHEKAAWTLRSIVIDSPQPAEHAL